MQKLGYETLGSSFDCMCGKTHRVPIEACYIGPRAAERLADFARDRCGESCLVLSDENTRPVGGPQVLSALASAGKTVEEHVYGRDPVIVTDIRGEEVTELSADYSFLVAVGSGCLSDLAKYAGKQHQKPVLVYPTAASMNGYTSEIVAMEVNGLKSVIPDAPATAVFADPEVAATAPTRMGAAGVADYFSKANAWPDWFMEHTLRGTHFCERPHEFYEATQDQLLAAAPAIGKRDPEAIAVCLHALMLSGLSMVVAGTTAPSSGGEHLISHYLDMKHLLAGTPVDLHGTQVGLGTLHCLRLWEKVAALDPDVLNVSALVEAHPSEDQVRKWIEEDWGSVAGLVLDQWRQKSRDKDGLRAELQRFQRKFPELRAAFGRYAIPSAKVAQAICDAGGPAEPDGLTAPTSEFSKALRFARFLRNRFTILDLAAELGIE